MKIAFLVSGNGGNLRFINTCIEEGILNNVDLYVIGDRECGAVEYASEKNIFNKVIKYSRNNNYELLQLLKTIGPDIIITNVHKVLDKEIVNIFNIKMINLHYSLLPLYKGMIGEEPIVKAMEDGCKFIGCTVHYVSQDVDEGEIIIQGITRNTGKLKEIVNNIFRLGCMILLNTIMNFNPENLLESKINQNNFYITNPVLSFDTSVFDEKFWYKI